MDRFSLLGILFIAPFLFSFQSQNNLYVNTHLPSNSFYLDNESIKLGKQQRRNRARYFYA
jgi:hypothetical protein